MLSFFSFRIPPLYGTNIQLARLQGEIYAQLTGNPALFSACGRGLGQSGDAGDQRQAGIEQIDKPAYQQRCHHSPHPQAVEPMEKYQGHGEGEINY